MNPFSQQTMQMTLSFSHLDLVDLNFEFHEVQYKDCCWFVSLTPAKLVSRSLQVKRFPSPSSYFHWLYLRWSSCSRIEKTRRRIQKRFKIVETFTRHFRLISSIYALTFQIRYLSIRFTCVRKVKVKRNLFQRNFLPQEISRLWKFNIHRKPVCIPRKRKHLSSNKVKVANKQLSFHPLRFNSSPNYAIISSKDLKTKSTSSNPKCQRGIFSSKSNQI